MKKYSLYILLLIIGIGLGWVISSNFSSKIKVTDSKKSESIMESKQKWTCSMHPQIMQSEPGDCPICGMDLIPAEQSSEGLQADEFKLTKNAMALASVQTTIVKNKLNLSNKDESIILSGKIKENENANTIEVSHFAGRIEKLYVNFMGEKVRKGQIIAKIYSPDLVKTQQELLTTALIKNSQPELYQSIRDKLKLWKLTDSQIYKIESSGKIQENFPIYASNSGTVSEMHVQKGDYLKRGQGLFKMDNLNTLWIIFDVYENQLNEIKINQELDVKIHAYPKESFKAKISFIYPTLDEKTRTIKVRALIKNNGVLKPGMFAVGRLNSKYLTKNPKKIIFIPGSAVLWTGKRSVVYIKTDSNSPTFEMREIEIGTKVGTNYPVISGIKIGDEIVTNGAFTLDAAAQLQGKKSMMNNGDNSDEHKNHNSMNNMTENKEIVIEKLDAPQAFKLQLKEVYLSYELLKNSLVETNSTKASLNAKKTLLEINKIDMKLLKENKAHKTWMNSEKPLKENLFIIKETEDVKSQRNAFKIISKKLIHLIKTFGLDITIYEQFCPMADNNKGGSWLSSENKVQNPYFGSKMLKCGSVKETIKLHK